MDIYASELGVKKEELYQVDRGASLASIGLHSMNYMKCLFKIEEVYGVTFDDEKSLYLNMKTFGQLLDFIEVCISEQQLRGENPL
jgi:acyl carrier protein